MSSRESCRAVMKCTRAPKDISFSVPNKLRFFVLSYAISDIRDRSRSTSAAGTPTAPIILHTASGNVDRSRFASRIGMRTGSRDRSLMKISACRRPMCSTLPYQSPSRGGPHRRLVVELLQPDKQPLCAAQYHHAVDRVPHANQRAALTANPTTGMPGQAGRWSGRSQGLWRPGSRDPARVSAMFLTGMLARLCMIITTRSCTRSRRGSVHDPRRDPVPELQDKPTPTIGA